MYTDNSKIVQFFTTEIKHSLTEFFTDWFFLYPKKIFKFLVNNFKEFDRSLGLQAMTKNWLNPLYQDYNFWGYVIGIAIRTVYIFIAGMSFFAIYLVISIFILALWYFIPFLILWQIVRNIFAI